MHGPTRPYADRCADGTRNDLNIVIGAMTEVQEKTGTRVINQGRKKLFVTLVASLLIKIALHTGRRQRRLLVRHRVGRP